MKNYTKAKQIQHCQQWIAALRSGVYKQGHDVLRRDNEESDPKQPNHCYCCLGVACDISNLGEWKQTPDGNYWAYYISENEENDSVLTETICNYYGLKDHNGYFHLPKSIYEDERQSITHLNDFYFEDFNTIADVIEEIVSKDAWMSESNDDNK